jgi:integrase
MSIEGKAPSTVNTYTASISYVHKINGWEDPCDYFIIKKLKDDCKRQKGRPDNRRPITIPILVRLINLLHAICASNYEAIRFETAFLVAFFGFLRIGELAADSNVINNGHIIGIHDVAIKGNHMNLTIRSSKTDQKGDSTTLKFERVTSGGLCPVRAMERFLAIRPDKEGPLLIHFGGRPLTRYQFDHMLKKGISNMGLDHKVFSPHSFRIGAATAAAVGGVPIESIKSMGRWKSSAVLLYIRPQRMIQSIGRTAKC